MVPGRDMVIGLDHFTQFGYKMERKPALPHTTHNEPANESAFNTEDEDGEDQVDGINAQELYPKVTETLKLNQCLPSTSYSTHPLEILPLKPIDITPV